MSLVLIYTLIFAVFHLSLCKEAFLASQHVYSISSKSSGGVADSDEANIAKFPYLTHASVIYEYMSQTEVSEKLRYLSAPSCIFNSEEFQKLCNRISKLKSLESIILDGSRLTSNNLRCLIQSLRKLSNLRTVSLSQCGLDDAHMDSIGFLAKTHLHITSWDLSHNHFTVKSLGSLSRILLSNANCSLEMLDLSYNNVGSNFYLLLEEAARKQKLRNLKYLSIKQLGMNNKECLQILKTLNNNTAPSLQHLDLSGNHLLSGSNSVPKHSAMNSLLSDSNTRLLLDNALQALTTSFSLPMAGAKHKAIKRKPVLIQAKSTRAKLQSKKNRSMGKVKIVLKEDSNQLLAQKLLQYVRASQLKYFGLNKTGLDPKFACVLAKEASKYGSNTIPEQTEDLCRVDIRLNNLNIQELEDIFRRIMM